MNREIEIKILLTEAQFRTIRDYALSADGKTVEQLVKSALSLPLSHKVVFHFLLLSLPVLFLQHPLSFLFCQPFLLKSFGFLAGKSFLDSTGNNRYLSKFHKSYPDSLRSRFLHHN